MEPDEPDSFRMMCNVDLMWLIGKHAGLSVLEAAKVDAWKSKYLSVWDDYIDGLEPEAEYKQARRKVIVKTFDRLINLCRKQERETET